MNNKIFISHSSKNEAIAMEICEFLEKNGKKCFIAPRDIKQGETYAESIVNGIDNCDSVILLLSEEANLSPHILREIERAVSKNKKIFSYKIEEVEVSKSLEYFINITQWVYIKSPADYEIILAAVDNNEMAVKSSVKQKRKAITSIIFPFVIIILAVALAFILSNSKNNKESNNENLAPSQQEGISESTTKDETEEPNEELTETHSMETSIKIGDTITFGKYYDDPVEWYVLDINENKATLVTKYIITMKAYDAAEGGEYSMCNGRLFREMSDEEKEDYNNQKIAYGSNDYATSNIRTWLNSDRAKVEYRDNPPNKNSMSDKRNEYDTEEGFLYNFTDTEKAMLTENANGDKAFLLSRDEVNSLFDKANLRIYTTCTEKAYEKDGCNWYNSDYYCANDNDYYWYTRDAVEGTANKVYLITNGSDPEHIREVNAGLEGYGIRPAITLDLAKFISEDK